jgi:NADH pyrophosphatase NudC (nudix superfamily)
VAFGIADVASFDDLRAAVRCCPPRRRDRAQARTMVDWHARHRHCAACGGHTRSVLGGANRVCFDCQAEHFPRTDPVAIAVVVRGDQCLLGRGPGWPAHMFSALAGFVEAGESLEDAVRREVMEESGVRVGRVRYLASQPWPFPCSLMLGCVAQAESEAIAIDPAELEEARWFSRDALRARSRIAQGPGVPPPFAIAHHLIRAWIDTDAGGVDSPWLRRARARDRRSRAPRAWLDERGIPARVAARGALRVGRRVERDLRALARRTPLRAAPPAGRAAGRPQRDDAARDTACSPRSPTATCRTRACAARATTLRDGRRVVLRDGLHRRLVADAARGRSLAAAVRRRPRRAARARVRAGRRDRRRLARVDWRAAVSPTSASPTASSRARSTAGSRTSRRSRFASCPASTPPRPGCARTRPRRSRPASSTATTSSRT